jgi:inner membrane protein
VLGYIGLNLLISQAAYADVRRTSADEKRIFASPPPVLFWRRDLVWSEGGRYCRATYDPLGGGYRAGSCAPSNMGDPLVQEAIRGDPRLQKFLKWSVLPQADVTRGRCTIRVSIGDARYGDATRSRLARESIVPTRARGC